MTMTWAIIIFLAGILIGALAVRLTNKSVKQQKTLKKELDKSKYELEQFRQELVDHFARSADLLDNVAKDYSKLYEHMAKTSTELMPNLPAQDNPFAKRITSLETVKDDAKEDESVEQAPRDYANGATGLFNGENTAVTEEEKAQLHTEPKAS